MEMCGDGVAVGTCIHVVMDGGKPMMLSKKHYFNSIQTS
jgi:hypothetical protein